MKTGNKFFAELFGTFVLVFVGACLAGIVYKCISGDCSCKKCEK